MNLGKVPEEKHVLQGLMDIATYLKEDGQGQEQKFISDLGKISVYDIGTIMRAINILADDLEMAVSGQSARGSGSSRRIATGSRSIRCTGVVGGSLCQIWLQAFEHHFLVVHLAVLDVVEGNLVGTPYKNTRAKVRFPGCCNRGFPPS